MESVYEKLAAYRNKDIYPFHMPGHKRNSLYNDWGFPFAWDITEIEGFDNLHHQEGVLREASDRLSRVFGARQSWFCVNGSTAAVMAMISAAVKPKGHILMARNCHKSAYHAAYLRQLEVSYLYPVRTVLIQGENEHNFSGRFQIDHFRKKSIISEELISGKLSSEENTFNKYTSEEYISGEIRAEDVREALSRDPSIQAVLITSPTYDGIVSDIESIAREVHSFGAVLLVDEAHGAHFPFSDSFPVSAIQCGADLVAQSLHKTLPALTQSAVLHLCSERIEARLVERFLGMFQTSSPSYILMSSMDRCVRFLSEESKKAFLSFGSLLDRARGMLGENLLVPYGVYDYDKSKLLIRAADGYAFARELREAYHIEAEMAARHYVLALSSVGDTREGMDRLCHAVRRLSEKEKAGCGGFDPEPDFESVLRGSLQPGHVMSVYSAMDAEDEIVLLEESEERISAEFVYLYPPGIPFLVPGEKITGDLIPVLLWYREHGVSLQGLSDYSSRTIRVVK